MVVLFIAEVDLTFFVEVFAEGEMRRGDVSGGVVVECRGADLFVDLSFNVPGSAFILGFLGGEVDVGEFDYDL